MTGAGEGELLAGRYRLVAPLGRGATATVWRARDLDLGREVAVKVLHPGVGDDATADRFRREGELLQRVTHPNLARVLGAGEDGDVAFLVMELVEGASLRQLLTQGPFAEDEAVRIAGSVAAGLAAAHTAGIVHRDVTPANILVGNDDVPRLVDFGIARAADLTAMTQADTVLGTVAYLAPEQARGEPVSPATDVYALGCVLVELVAGRPPFQADTAVALAYRHVHDPAPALQELAPEASAALAAVVARCLAKAPGDRYATADELAADLRRVGRGEDVAPMVAAAAGADTDAEDRDATVAIAPVPADGTMVLPAVAGASAAGASAAEASAAGPTASGPLLPTRFRLPVAVGAGVVAVLLLLLALTAGGKPGTPARADTSTTSSTMVVTTTLAPPTTATPVAPPPRPGKVKQHKGD